MNSRKLSKLVGGGAVLSALAPQADAGIVSASGLPAFPPDSAGNSFWDVDGNGTNDFRLFNYFSYAAKIYSTSYNGAKFVLTGAVSSFKFANLSAGFLVGNTLPGGAIFGSAFAYSAINQNAVTVGNALGGYMGAGWTNPGTGYFGFSFISDGNTYYGWAEMVIGDRGSVSQPGDNYMITRAYYNATPGESIQVGAIPEPSSVALLALGAGGLAAWRRRKQAA
ncbi:MAG: PEP-CTERM sorting domain-containing protein [Chthoniobacterales bacterium]